jgi:hypothetical protein
MYWSKLIFSVDYSSALIPISLEVFWSENLRYIGLLLEEYSILSTSSSETSIYEYENTEGERRVLP